MIKKNHYLILFLIIISSVVFYYQKKTTKNISNSKIEHPLPPEKVNYEETTIDEKKVVGLKPGQEKDQLEKLKIGNTVSKDWEIQLEKNLLNQGGESIKSLEIKKVDSFIWYQDNNALHVESVAVSIKNQQNAETSFRALVDAQTGKILRTWDQPVFDPAHPKDNFKIKLDPRYHSD